MDFESCWEKPPSPLAPCPGVPSEGHCFGSVPHNSHRLLLPFSAWLPGPPLQPPPCCVPCCSPASTAPAPIQKQLLCEKSTPSPECSSGEVDVEQQSEDCWLGASSPTLLRTKWHFSASQNSMTTFECPNGTVCRYDKGFFFVTRSISVGDKSC